MSLEFESNATSSDAEVPVSAPHVRRTESETRSEPPTRSDLTAEDGAQESFAEVALRLGGASKEEARRTGAVDTADDQVEELFADPYKTANSPVHRAVWESSVDSSLFSSDEATSSETVEAVVQRSLEVVQRHRRDGTLVNSEGKIAVPVLRELGDAGYWGLLVDPQYGGSGATMTQFAAMITRMAMIEPTVAGLASVHGCIGAVDPVRSFGNADQRRRFLPRLASGESLSAFALTEPGAGSDLTALRTTAVRDGDHFIVNGEKLFITNAIPGRTIGLVCKIDGRPSVLVVELPPQETPSFRLKRYGIYALRRAHNNGLVFRNFRVPAENLLVPSQGDGLTIAYHGLNLGRISLCANAAGAMRWMMADMIPWAQYRQTYGQAIEKRELVRRRIGSLAGLIVGCDAMTQWCAGLIDRGYRGEMECIVAKVFGSEAQKEAAIELFMKTHGGRSFLAGHLFGDNVHEFLAPCIYEGEGEMLSMAFFKSLVKRHGKAFFEPIGRTMNDLGVSSPNLMNPKHLWALRKPMVSYGTWYAGRVCRPTRWTESPDMPANLAAHANFAKRVLSRAGLSISGTMRRYQLKLADRQCRMSAISVSLQNAVVMLVTSMYAAKQTDPITRAAGDVLCRELRKKIAGGRPTDNDFRATVDVGRMIAEGAWPALEGTMSDGVMMKYE